MFPKVKIKYLLQCSSNVFFNQLELLRGIKTLMLELGARNSIPPHINTHTHTCINTHTYLSINQSINQSYFVFVCCALDRSMFALLSFKKPYTHYYFQMAHIKMHVRSIAWNSSESPCDFTK